MSLIDEVEILEFDATVRYAYSPSGEPLARSEAARERVTRRFGIRIVTADGLEGGYVVLWSAPPLATLQVKAMARTLLGRSIWERERIWDTLNSGVYAKTDRIGAGAIDIALWDAAGAATGQPVASLLGRYRDRLPAYVSTVGGGHGIGALWDPASYRRYAEACAERGIRGFKVHGPSRGAVREEIEVLEAVAEGSAGRLDVMFDAGKSLSTLADALALGRACDDVGAYWWEDPMRDSAPFGHRVLRERVRTPLLLTEFVRGLDLRVAVALAGGTDMLRADPELDMGITGVLKTAHAAEALGLDLEVHASGPAQRHCMAAIRNTNYYELGLLDPVSGNAGMPDVFAGDEYRDTIEAIDGDGCVAVPDGPGLGVTFDWERLRAQSVDRVLIR